MKSRIIVTGANGRLGAALVREWRAVGLDVTGFGRNELDISKSDAIAAKLNSEEFAVLVNCAAQTNVDRCETEADEAFELNAAAPTIMADACRKKGARIIHISTDYVFDGAKEGSYSEDDPAVPISIYGASKRAGEGVSDSRLNHSTSCCGVKISSLPCDQPSRARPLMMASGK